jgi:glycosyltransferase involved in cell wall biosynthesis
MAMAALASRLQRFEQRHTTAFRRHLVVSELDAERLKDLVPGAPVSVVANGVDTTYFDCPSNVDPASRRVLWVGPESWYPNRDAVRFLLTDIWPRIIGEEPGAELILIGGGISDETRAAAASDSRISPLGFVEDIRPDNAQAAVFVCPMRQGGGTRLKVLNTLAMRKAMVCTRMGAEGIPLQHETHYLQADTAADIAAAVLRLMRDPNLRGRLGEAARKLIVEQFDWGPIGEELFEVYQSVIEEPEAAL